jgi:hypothetical protein
MARKGRLGVRMISAQLVRRAQNKQSILGTLINESFTIQSFAKEILAKTGC